MIAFRKGFAPDDEHSISKAHLKKLVKAFLPKGNASFIHSYHGGLSLAQIEMIISHLMYTKGSDSINITIEKESDGYHLGLTVHNVDQDDKDESTYL